MAPPVVPIGVFDAERCVSHDRLPLAGAVVDAPAVQSDPQRWRGTHLMDLPRMPGVFVLAALGSRGLTLATLSAQLIAAQLEGEPAPLTRDLIDVGAYVPGSDSDVDTARMLWPRINAFLRQSTDEMATIDDSWRQLHDLVGGV